MRSTRYLFVSLGLFAAAACSSPDKSGGGSLTPPKAASLEVDLTVSSVNLGSDCPDPVAAKPAAPPMADSPAARAANQAPSSAVPSSPPALAAEAESSEVSAKRRAGFAASDCAGEGCGRGFGPCQQSSMQLALAAKGTGSATKIEIVKVELLDASGAVIGELAARRPQLWQDASGNYGPWDGNVATAGDLKAMFSLSAPDWSKVPGGRYGSAAGLSVRVTVAIGDQRVTKSATAVSVMVDPQVVT
ncbi:MAG: hypothetical protein IPL79_13125 [Myxococcales bacterium]|nr:hypothetical protein [Myxococcales bacterium]